MKGCNIQEKIFKLEAISHWAIWVVIVSDTESDLSWLMRYMLKDWVEKYPAWARPDMSLCIALERDEHELKWELFSPKDLKNPMVKIQHRL